MKTLALAAACTALITTAAHAAPANEELYIGATGDITFPRDTTVTGTSTGKLNYKFSSGGNLEFGYQPMMLNNNWGDVRLEAEGGYHAFGLNKAIVNGVTNTRPGSDLKDTTLMGNFYYDLHTNSRFTPYIGAGLGEAWIDLPKQAGFGNTSSSDSRLAYQFMAGVSYTPEMLPMTDWSLGYRYMGTTSPEFATASGNVKLDAIHASSIELGVKYHF